ncbi:MAG: M20/M25/M40 family metallo-hydrolase [Flavobacteriales bacterium]|nr:M20/M25/M40 family metallo-hydrolase [Flavobacteriales bacterium]
MKLLPSFFLFSLGLATSFNGMTQSTELSKAEPADHVDFLDDQQAIDEFFRLALTESNVYQWLGDMCLNIGPRLSGSPQADQAVEFSYDLMVKLGLDARKQSLMVPVWQRGEAEQAFYKTSSGVSGEINVLALGGSVATEGDGLFAPIIEVASWEELEALGKEQIEGKIVFFNEKMDAENLYTFHSYGHCVRHRWGGAVEAAKYGAAGALVRSLNLRIDDFPHTGSMKYDEGIDSIPAAAVSTQDAETLSRLLAESQEVKVMMRQSCQTLPDKESFNVIGEIKGSEHPDRVIVVGGHLDSWDVGHGAHDDGAGVMQSLGVLELLNKIGYAPKNTVRVVFFMNEENGLRGAKKYGEWAETSGETHIAAIESDRGGFTPRGFHVDGSEAQLEKMLSWEKVLDKFGIHQVEEGGSGADIGPLKTDDNVLIGFVPDSQRYFDHHHSANDTFDQVNKRELELGTASIAALVYLIDKYGL